LPAAPHPASAAPQAQSIPGIDVAIPGLGNSEQAAPAAQAAAVSAPQPAAPQPQQQVAPQREAAAQAAKPGRGRNARSDNYYDIKTTIFNALIDAIDLTQLGQLDRDSAREEIRDVVNEIISLKEPRHVDCRAGR
jgi:pilus assembly protein CpaF